MEKLFKDLSLQKLARHLRREGLRQLFAWILPHQYLNVDLLQRQSDAQRTQRLAWDLFVLAHLLAQQSVAQLKLRAPASSRQQRPQFGILRLAWYRFQSKAQLHAFAHFASDSKSRVMNLVSLQFKRLSQRCLCTESMFKFLRFDWFKFEFLLP